MSWVFGAESLACGAERLARVTAREDVHAITKLCPWEGFKIRPDRCRVQESRFHLCNQVRAGEGFDLANSDCAQTWIARWSPRSMPPYPAQRETCVIVLVVSTLVCSFILSVTIITRWVSHWPSRSLHSGDAGCCLCCSSRRIAARG